MDCMIKELTSCMIDDGKSISDFKVCELNWPFEQNLICPLESTFMDGNSSGCQNEQEVYNPKLLQWQSMIPPGPGGNSWMNFLL